MKLKDVAIAIVWIVVLAVTFYRGTELGHLHNPPGCATRCPPMHIWFIVLPLSFIVSSVGVLLFKDRVGRRGTYTECHKRLRSTALIMVACLIFGVVGLASTYANEQNSHAYFGGALSLSVGLGLLVAYFLSPRFPPGLY
jgi:hypothetical protein